MKRKTKVSLVVAATVLIAPVVLSPFWIHNKNHVIEPSVVVAEDNNSSQSPEKTVSPSTDPFSKNQFIDSTPGERTLKPKPQPISENNFNKKPGLHPEKKTRAKKEKDNLGPVNNESLNRNPQKVLVTDNTGKKPSNAGNETAGNSKWGAAIIANESSADVAVTYRLVQLPLLGESDLDVLVGTKEAGVGLSKSLNKKWGVGLTGTVSYDDGDKRLGVYAKYKF